MTASRQPRPKASKRAPSARIRATQHDISDMAILHFHTQGCSIVSKTGLGSARLRNAAKRFESSNAFVASFKDPIGTNQVDETQLLEFAVVPDLVNDERKSNP